MPRHGRLAARAFGARPLKTAVGAVESLALVEAYAAMEGLPAADTACGVDLD